MHKSGLIDLQALLAVARRQSFRAAALELEMSTSAVSSAVAGLEARLGSRLLHRTTRSVALTDAGQQFVDQIAPAVKQIQDAMATVNDRRATPTGTLRINSSLGAALIANGVISNPNAPASDPLAPIRRMSQAEKIAFFS